MNRQLALILCCLISSVALGQQNYFVSTSGSDMANGAMATPWKTIQYGIYQLQPGDTLNVLAGVYPEKLFLGTSGAANAMITIRAYQGQSVTLDASGFSDDISFFYASNRSHIRVEGLHFRNCFSSDGAGFNVEGVGTNWHLKDCTFSNIGISADTNATVTFHTNIPIVLFRGSGASDSLTNIRIEGLEIYDCRPGYSECISIVGNVSGFLVQDNHIHHNKNIAILAAGNYKDSPTPSLDHARHGIIRRNHVHHNGAPYSAAAGLYVDGGYHVIVENNVSHHNDFGGEIGCEEAGDARYVIFRNNVFYANRVAGMQLGGYDVGTGGLVSHSKVLNNTFYQNDVLADGNGELLFSQFENGVCRNNIFYLSAHNYLLSNSRAQPNLDYDYNLVYTSSGSTSVESYLNGADHTGLPDIYTALGAGSHNTFGDPTFANAANADFHINAASPAHDAGDPQYSSSANEMDIDGQIRVDGAVDCGADEWHADVEYVNLGSDCIIIQQNISLTSARIIGNLSDYRIKLYDGMDVELADYTGASSPLMIDYESLPTGAVFISFEHLIISDLSAIINLKDQ